MDTISTRTARRLALTRGGLLKPEWTDQPRRAAGTGRRARDGAQRVIRRFGYLQLDTVSVAGARSHGIVLGSRLDGFDPRFAERLLEPGEPLFEYWGHEASWLPIELYPLFGFRRDEFRQHLGHDGDPRPDVAPQAEPPRCRRCPRTAGGAGRGGVVCGDDGRRRPPGGLDPSVGS